MDNDTTTPFTQRLHALRRRIIPPRPIRFVLWVTVVSVAIFSLVRIALVVRNLELLNSGIDNSLGWVLRSLWVGVRFDIALVTKIMALPLILLGTALYIRRFDRLFAVAATWVGAILLSISLMVDISNIPFFEYCNSHLNAVAISYLTTDVGQAASMITEGYLICICIVIISATIFSIFVVRMARHYRIREFDGTYRMRTTIYAILLLGLLPVTSRGMSFKTRPMHYADAIISNNNFLNQVCLNPVEPFIKTIIEGNERIIDIMDSKVAFDYVCQSMGRDESFTTHVEAKPSPWRNIVVIIQEGNSAERLAREGNTQGLLPNLDRMIEEGLYFENTYSSSTHTCYGIYGIVASMPPYMDLHPLKDGVQKSHGTIYEQVYERGDMTTLFYITHRPEFDNVNGFVAMQGFERLTAEDDYGVPSEKTWGVDDHIMYDRALQDIDKEWQAGNDVAAVLLTCSNHRPFDAPTMEGFTPKSSDAEEEAIEYADWAMNRFIEMAKEREWFDETLFVITSDHGRAFTEDYIMNESIFHIPLLFYSPKHIAPEVRSEIASQADITPTAFAMMGKEYDNATMGIDLMTSSREYAVFTSVTHLACRSSEWLYAHDPDAKIDYLYDLNAEGEARYDNVAEEHSEIVETMRHHAMATIQAGWDIHNTPASETENE
ncbi:MAG: sulfatase-like hydrolase/transferase [Alistipes sp.]|nr:sulfatase-like hydrolase/transferase [Alistipes sp.]